MEDNIFNELQQIKAMALLAAKNILSVADLALLLGISEKTIRNNIDKYPHYKDEWGRIWFKRIEIENSLCRVKCYHQ